MFAQRAMAVASVVALGACATPFSETPALCTAMIDVAREAATGADVRAVSFVERDGVVSCQAEGRSAAICAAYAANVPGAGLAPIGAAVRSCLYGHGYVRTVERRDLRGETIIANIRGGFRFHAVVLLRLDDEGRRYELDLQERIIITEARGSRDVG